MQEHYAKKNQPAPYKTLAGFRRARRAQATEYKENRKVWDKSLTISESDVIITNESRDLKSAIDNAEFLVASTFERYQQNLQIIDSKDTFYRNKQGQIVGRISKGYTYEYSFYQ
ncbi:MAG: hypothetical protein E7352_01275 [Clostridiales bacterium]|nr:hypothetical protein [Clostridiales bacterium]MBE5746794.1 hypothetical protein [Clostridiales bacterium]